ncbi:MAG: hypothetical protein RR101_15300, partial [Burkholderiaceae bacterium]
MSDNVISINGTAITADDLDRAAKNLRETTALRDVIARTPPSATRFDTGTLAAGWLAVAQAAGTHPQELAELFKTVAIELFPEGVRLVSTDRLILLTAWCPRLGYDGPEPGIEVLPDRTVIASDPDGRGKGLLGYALKLLAKAHREDSLAASQPGRFPLDLEVDAEKPVDDDGNVMLDGMADRYVVLSIPDTERVFLRIIPSRFPDWRTMLDGWAPLEASATAYNPDVLARVCGASKWCDGPLVWKFAGPEKAAVVDYIESFPHVSGLVMPRRLDKGFNQVDAPAPDDYTAELLNAAGVVVADTTLTPKDDLGPVLL